MVKIFTAAGNSFLVSREILKCVMNYKGGINDVEKIFLKTLIESVKLDGARKNVPKCNI